MEHPDHPRSRGEYPDPPASAPKAAGSSPLSRGIRGVGALPHRNGRIIPALAGNTSLTEFAGVFRQDHPRSRGEYPLPDDRCVYRLGSSPLSRGIP